MIIKLTFSYQRTIPISVNPFIYISYTPWKFFMINTLPGTISIVPICSLTALLSSSITIIICVAIPISTFNSNLFRSNLNIIIKSTVTKLYRYTTLIRKFFSDVAPFIYLCPLCTYRFIAY